VWMPPISLSNCSFWMRIICFRCLRAQPVLRLRDSAVRKNLRTGGPLEAFVQWTDASGVSTLPGCGS
ncbi:MAG: hypothetical protein IJT94_10435, partial [Oscillibacter sp.]|nr:hypothetical protein [Oscillibacter sp.]